MAEPRKERRDGLVASSGASHQRAISLTKRTKEAIRLVEEADDAIKRRDKALDGLAQTVGGDRLAAIRNAQRHIGELLTDA